VKPSHTAAISVKVTVACSALRLAAANRVRTLVMMIRPPTATPITRAGILVTSQAATGAAISPPSRSAATIPQSIPSAPRLARKPTLAAVETRNSLVSTDPITVRGAVFPALNSDVVDTGPHPPPPVASTKPPNRPSGIRKRARWGETLARATRGGLKA